MNNFEREKRNSRYHSYSRFHSLNEWVRGPWSAAAVLLMGVSLSLLGLAFAGCNGGEEKNDGQASGNLLDELPGPGSAAGGATAANDPTSDELPAEQRRESKLLDDETFATEINRLSQEANQLESELQFGEAVQRWEQMLDLVSQRHGSDSWQTRNVQLALRTSQHAAGFTDAQLAQVRQLAELRQKIGQAVRQRDFSQAYDIGLEVFETTQMLFGKQSFLSARCQIELGEIAVSDGQNPQLALNFYVAALEILQQEFGMLHPETEATLFRIGQSLQQNGQLEQALSYLESSTQIAEKVWGKDDTTYASRSHDLGVVYHRTGKLEESRQAISRAVKIRRERLGDTHPQVGHALRNLAVVHQDLNQLDVASRMFKEAIEIFLARYGAGNGFTIDAQLQLATVLSLLKQYPDAENVLATAAQAQGNALGQRDASYVETLSKLGIVMCYQAKYDKAEPLLKHALEVQSAQLGRSNPLTQRTLAAYVKMLERTDRAALAAEFAAEIRQTGFEQPDDSSKSDQ